MRISDKGEADTFLAPEIFHHLIPSGRGSQVFMVRRMKVATEVSDIENTCYPTQYLLLLLLKLMLAPDYAGPWLCYAMLCFSFVRENVK